MLTCKAFAMLGREGSSRLWEDVACRPRGSGQMGKVLLWLQRKQRMVQRLSLHTTADQQPPVALWGLMTSSFTLLRDRLLRCGWRAAGLADSASGCYRRRPILVLPMRCAVSMPG